MPYLIEYKTDKHYLLGTVSGDISAKEALVISDEGMAYAKQYPECHAVLLDMREARFDFSMADSFYFPRLVSRHADGLKMRAHSFVTAMLVAKKSQSWEFLETVNFNMGFRTKIFTDIAEAESWLAELGGAAS